MPRKSLPANPRCPSGQSESWLSTIPPWCAASSPAGSRKSPASKSSRAIANGKLAVEDVARSAPDIVLLDIEMPVMDGLEALPLLLKARPGMRVLMVSTLTKRNAEISFKALALGAIDYVPKPDSNREITIQPDFRREVIGKIKVLGPLSLRRKGADIPGSTRLRSVKSARKAALSAGAPSPWYRRA